jgi:hypothetical protein
LKNRTWRLGDQGDCLDDEESTVFTDPIPRLMVYLFVKHGLKFFVEYNITYTCNFFGDFVYMNVLLKKKNVVHDENLENFR